MKLLTKEVLRHLPPLGANAENSLEETIAYVKFFYPDFGWTWYGAEFDGTDIFWGLVIGYEKEYGTFSLSELQSTRGKLGLSIERDRHFKPTSLEELYERENTESGL